MDFFFHVWREFIPIFFSFCGSVSRVVKGNPEPYFPVGWRIAKQHLRGLYPIRIFFGIILSIFELFTKFVAVFFTLTNAGVVM